MEELLKYFTDLSERQIEQFESLQSLYEDWNAQINVISRKDIDQIYIRHILHALALPKIFIPKPKTRFLDVGTGGGFPGIPLAIFFPECEFHLIDSIGKKIKVVNEISNALGLDNIYAEHTNAKNLTSTYDFVLSRAVAPADKIVSWTENCISENSNNEFKNGWFFLKGGNLEKEFERHKEVKRFFLQDFFNNPFFETKQLIYFPRN